MKPFTTSIDIAAPPERVWPIMRDVERWHEWTPSITSVELLGPGPFGVGSRARVRQPKLPPAEWTVTELVEGHHFTWVTRAPGITGIGRHVVEAHGSGSRVTLGVEHEGVLGPLVARLTRGITERYIAMEAAGLKKRSEQ